MPRFSIAQSSFVYVSTFAALNAAFLLAEPSASAAEPEPPSAPSGGEPGAPAAEASWVEPHGPIELDVHGHHVPPPRSSSDVLLEVDVLSAAPHRNAAELLAAAPGVYVARPEGDAVAHQIFLRGFDAGHGQDIEFTLNGSVPVNQPSHVHGQGYADLNFILPEVVRAVRVTEGVFDPRQGDFAVAGSIDFSLGVLERGFKVRTSAGSFGMFRQLGVWAPRGEAEETFGAAAMSHSDGFGMNRETTAATGMAQLAFRGPAGFRGVALVTAHGARGAIPGTVRRDDMALGRVGFYDSYPDPSANNQVSSTARVLASVQLERPRESGGSTGVSAWLSYVDNNTVENFTGYTLPSRTEPSVPGDGDRIDQKNGDFGAGLRAYHRSSRFSPATWLDGHAEVGAAFAGHRIEQSANLVRAPGDAVWDRRLDAAVWQGDLGIYGDVDLRLSPYLRLRGGVRADVLGFDVEDRFGGATSVDPNASSLVPSRHRALGVAVGPRATVEVVPTHWLHAIASYGEGYRSPQALQTARGDGVPFARVRSFETGLKLHPWGGSVTLSASGFATLSSNDLMFEPAEGVLEPIGPTTRRGVAAHVIVRAFEWLLASASVTSTRATLDPVDEHEEHDAEAEEKQGGHVAVHGGGAAEGGLVPSVPALVVRADVGAKRALTTVRGAPLEGRVGAGFSYLGARPLAGGEFTDPVALLDASASLRWRFIDFTVDVFNVADAAYAATEMKYVSNWRTGTQPSSEPARHAVAGPPRSLQATLGLAF